MCKESLDIIRLAAIVIAFSLLVSAAGMVRDVHAAIPTAEREALIALYNSTDGDNWNENTNWLGAPGTEGTWYGITVSNDHVVKIDLAQNRLTGPIPSELGNLIHLEELDLYANQLTGTIPPELGNLSSLTALKLHTNQLTGSIPPELGNLSNLKSLELPLNQLTGSIPSELGNLANLEWLSLRSNQLTGTIPPELGNLVNLTVLKLNGNELTGGIPPELGNLVRLKQLELNGNQLTGTIPSELGNLTDLEVWLWLDNNQLTGSIPPQLGNLTKLQELRLQNNQLTGIIPSELSNLINLKQFLLGGNQLTGPVPPWLGNLTNLEELKLYDNQLTGSILSELGDLINLVELLLDGNQLTGTIPAELGNLANLTRLDLGGNQLTGPISPELRNLANLVTLRLFENQLTGPIPPQLGTLVNLQEIILNHNQLTGNIPPQLGNLTDLNWLNLYGNQLTGTIPPELGNLSNLFGLYLGENELTDIIPIELGNLINLKELNLQVNQLTGPIPLELGNLASLELLYLRDNQLAGAIPPQLGNLTNLSVLSLGTNQLTGTIPLELGNLSNVEELLLYLNQLTGPIPAEIGNLTNLKELHLAGNQLAGPIPPELGNLANLQSLYLGNNQLTGTIPPVIGNLTNLQLLSLWGNQLMGTIPPELGNLAGLEHIDINSNQLEGPVPREVLNLTNLIDNESDFRWNKLYTSDSEVREFLNRKQIGGNWENTQAITLTLTSPVLLPGLYRMISVPLWATDPLEVFGDDLGAYDPTMWRLFWTNPETGQYQEYPEVPHVSPGIAYWLITRDGGSIDATGNQVTNDIFSIPIPPGWFQLGNPFNGTIPKNDLTVEVPEPSTNSLLPSLGDGNRSRETKKDNRSDQLRVRSFVPFSESPLDNVLWEWDASANAWTTAAAMVPWGGWLVYNTSANPVTLIIPNPALGPGPAAGFLQVTVVDALTGDVLQGATVTLEGFAPVATDELGVATIPDTPTGTFALAIEKTGYITYRQEINLGAGPNTPTIALSPQLETGETRIVLTWGETPNDLDSHLTGPDAGEDRFHVYFGNRDPIGAGANLDLDDVSSFGPETITITEQRSGTYKYYVHDFTNQSDPGSTALAQSEGRIDIFREEGLAASFSVPSGAGTIWHVFNMDGETGAITPVNTMSSGDVPDNSMLSGGSEGSMRLQGTEIEVIFRKLPRKPYGN